MSKDPKYTRFPFKVLPYSLKHIAVPKELMVDYENGKLYVRSEDGSEDILLSSDSDDILKPHIEDYNNPHKVTKNQIGLENVKNIEQASLEDFLQHLKDTNPHHTTKEDVGLGNVENYGVASIDDVLNKTPNKYLTPKILNHILENYDIVKREPLLTINVVPEDAIVKVQINGEWVIGNQHEVSPGEYEYIVSKNGYFAKSGIVIMNNKDISIDIILDKVTHIMNRVFVDNYNIAALKSDNTMSLNSGNSNMTQGWMYAVDEDHSFIDFSVYFNTFVGLREDNSLRMISHYESHNEYSPDNPIIKYSDRIVPSGNEYLKVAAGRGIGTAIKTDGTIISFGDDMTFIKNTPKDNDFIDISIYDKYAIGVKSTGELKIWNGHYEELAAGSEENMMYVKDNMPTSNNFKHVSCSAYYAIGLKTDGTLEVWGRDSYLGNMSELIMEASEVKKVISAEYGAECLFLTEDGDMYEVTYSSITKLSSNIIDIGYNGSVYAGIKEDGTVISNKDYIDNIENHSNNHIIIGANMTPTYVKIISGMDRRHVVIPYRSKIQIFDTTDANIVIHHSDDYYDYTDVIYRPDSNIEYVFDFVKKDTSTYDKLIQNPVDYIHFVNDDTYYYGVDKDNSAFCNIDLGLVNNANIKQLCLIAKSYNTYDIYVLYDNGELYSYNKDTGFKPIYENTYIDEVVNSKSRLFCLDVDRRLIETNLLYDDSGSYIPNKSFINISTIADYSATAKTDDGSIVYWRSNRYSDGHYPITIQGESNNYTCPKVLRDMGLYIDNGAIRVIESNNISSKYNKIKDTSKLYNIKNMDVREWSGEGYIGVATDNNGKIHLWGDWNGYEYDKSNVHRSLTSIGDSIVYARIVNKGYGDLYILAITAYGVPLILLNGGYDSSTTNGYFKSIKFKVFKD